MKLGKSACLSLIIFGSLLCSAIRAADGEKTPFTGSWSAKSSEASSFSIDLTQIKDHLTGYHIAVAQHGNRIDSALPEEGPPSIKGTVTGGVAHVTFHSSYDDAAAGGEATLTIRGDTIEWKVIKSSGAYYIPLKSVLYREKTAPAPKPRAGSR